MKALIGMAAVILAACDGNTSAGRGRVSVRINSYCGDTAEFAMQAYRSVLNRHTSPIAALLRRRQIQALTAGLFATETTQSEGMSRITTDEGERCYLPSSLLRSEK